MKITKVELWNDTGFVDGAAEVPSMSDVLPTADVIITDELRPAKDELFSRLKISAVREQTEETTVFWAFEDLVNVSYVGVKYDRLDYTIYGWVDNVLMISDSPSPVTAIDWHIDYWRTFISSAKFGYGLVQKRPRALDDPIQKCQYRYRLAGDKLDVDPDGWGLNWLIFTYTNESADSKVTKVRTCVIPLDRDSVNVAYTIKIGETSVVCPSLQEVAEGRIAEVLGISATQITSAFVSSVPPFKVSKVDRETNTVTFETSGETVKTDAITVSFSNKCENYLISNTFIYNKNYGFKLGKYTMETGSEVAGSYISSASSFKTYLDGLKGVQSYENSYGADLSVPTRCYWMTLKELVALVAPTTAFVEGDTFTVKNCATSRSTSYSWGGGTNSTFVYSVTMSLADRTYTYGTSGWPDVTLYSDALLSGSYTYYRSNMQYAIGIEKTSEGSAGYAYTTSQNFYEYALTLTDKEGKPLRTTDTKEWTLLDMNGAPVGSLPWGIDCSEASVRCVVSSTSAYAQVRFQGIYSKSDGLEFNVPLAAVDIASNSWCDYVYSGSREYDITQRKMAANQALVSGITSTMGSAFQTGVIGGVGGSGGVSEMQIAQLQKMMMNQYRGTAGAHAISGIVGGGANTALRSGAGMLGMGLAGTAVDYLTTRYFNGKLQDAEDTLKAKQFDNITSTGNGWDWLWHGTVICFVNLVPDNYSLMQFSENIEKNGLTCSEPTSDCTSLVKAGGPLQIANVIVTGSIPVQAKNFIANRLSQGVRILTLHEPAEAVTEGSATLKGE